MQKIAKFLHQLSDKNVAVLFLLVGFFVFFNVLNNNFVLDDNSYIVHNPNAHTLNFSYFIQNNEDDHYRPVSATYISLLYSIFNQNVFFYHLTQLTLHAAVVFLIYAVFKRFLSKILALALSLIFLVHPMQVESVSYISSSVDVLYVLFGMLALHLAIQRRHLALNDYKGYLSYPSFAALLLSYNNPRDAKTVIDQGLHISPSHPTLLLYLAVAKYQLGDRSEALAIADNLVKQMPNQQTEMIYSRILNNLPISVTITIY